ncbi:hypothetical protein XENTR_v10012677 [Xenopus tropicalis]|uniref:Olfactory receptor n=1 Tax=Xenopus tropicalis TaxID=8364 RepID=A0A803JUX7_XENTR|nr:olfactory receptor 5I1 [Xenopus tropicalis]KAE8612016.1 hypothetical protein XENTR_v10012677 [Xenopus tropicalis]|eukprot:XP_004914367.1 PREDICTED: olfactory receptor 5I1-like [Xenopus tropicalis]
MKVCALRLNSSQANVQEFILSSISSIYEVQLLLSISFLVIYIITLASNAVIISIIQLDAHLQTPMYYFLTNLAFLDICYSSVTVPKLLDLQLTGRKTISFYGCIAQMYFFHVLGSSEMFLLVAMSYDRYVAICNPLRYSVIMRRAVVMTLKVCSWAGGFIHSTFHTAFLLRLSFSQYNKVDNFFCDATPLIKLSCSDTTMDEIMLLATPGILGPICFILTLVSYSYIVRSILKINSAQGRYRTFSSCASHLTVVTVFYGTGIFVYVQPMAVYWSANQFITVFYSIITPMLNPLIYTLRNKEIKKALGKILFKQSPMHANIHLLH